MTFGRPTAPALGAAGAAAAPAGDGIVRDTTTAQFTKDVIEASKTALVVVQFLSPRSAACKQLTPILEKLVRAHNGKVRLVRMDVDAHPAIASQLRIQALPTVYAFRDGRPLDGFAGPQPETAVKQFIDMALGDDPGADLQAALDEADAALASNDLQTAAEIYASVLQADAQNPNALAGLAKCYLTSKDLERAEQTLALVPPDKRSLAVVSAVQAGIELARQAAGAGDLAPLEAAVAATPANHQARIDLAIALAAHGRKEDAATQLLESIKLDRKWNDEAARKQLVKFFEAWGPKDAATLDARRRLSGVLFS